MKNMYIWLKVLGWVEISTLLIIVQTLIKIDYYPMVLLFLPTPIAILGIFTLKLKPMARRLNLLLSPFIVFTYCFGFMIVAEQVLFIFHSSFRIQEIHFNIIFIITLITHIVFFNTKAIKELFINKK